MGESKKILNCFLKVKIHFCITGVACCSTEPLANFLASSVKIVFERLAADCREIYLDVLQTKASDIRMEVEHVGAGTRWKSAGIAVFFGAERKIATFQNLTHDNNRVEVLALPSIKLLED